MHHLMDLIWSMLPGSAVPLRMRCHFAMIRARISRIHRLAVRPLLIFDFSSGYLLPIDSSFRHFGGSSCFGGFSLRFILSFWKLHCLRGDLFLISASLGGETYRVSLSAISISRCRAGEWPNDNIICIFGRSHLFQASMFGQSFVSETIRITFIVIRYNFSSGSMFLNKFISK